MGRLVDLLFKSGNARSAVNPPQARLQGRGRAIAGLVGGWLRGEAAGLYALISPEPLEAVISLLAIFIPSRSPSEVLAEQACRGGTRRETTESVYGQAGGDLARWKAVDTPQAA